jgi:protein SCO1/2
MKIASVALIVVALLACSDKQSKPLSEPGEKVYPLRGVIVSRNATHNALTIDHEAIPGFMEAMTMDYDVRGATVDQLPPDKKRIEARLHVTEHSYWVTDVKPLP